MELEEELATAEMLDVKHLADVIVEIGFECTRCGACCKGEEEEHIATVFPSEIRNIQKSKGMKWRDIARPMPFGMTEGVKGELKGETFEWALQIGNCGDCSFYRETDGGGVCGIYSDKPLICETYPFSIDLEGSSKPDVEIVQKIGGVVVHECEGIGREIDYEDAMKLAEILKKRTIRDIKEAIEVIEKYKNSKIKTRTMVVHDSEGAKDRDGKFL